MPRKKDPPPETTQGEDLEDIPSQEEEGEYELEEEMGESELEEEAQETEQEEEADEKKAEINTTLLYDIMALKNTASQDEIKKAYRKLALIKHPDKNPGDQAAAENFQKLQKAYQVLSDPKKRERYDQWGDDGTDTFNSKEWMNAYEYYRELHPEITKDDYTSYVDKFRGSK